MSPFESCRVTTVGRRPQGRRAGSKQTILWLRKRLFLIELAAKTHVTWLLYPESSLVDERRAVGI